MTNKKFKLAAMSMALTACVAAQPMIANAAETGDVQEPVSNTNESSTSPQSAPADENDSVQSGEDGGAGASAEEKKEDGVNQEADKTEEAFGEDVDINYNPATKTEDPDTGSSTIKGDVVKKDEDKGESEDKSESEGEGETVEKKDEESEKIGDATKTETPDPDGTVTEDPVPKPGGESKTESKPGVDKDGNTTITNTTTTEGTQTSTSTGSGHAEADTKEETETKKEDIDLKDELGGAEIDWDVKRDADVGDTGYKVASVETIEDGKQTLTLKKVDTVSGEMSAEDIAKLVDAETPTVNEDGSYTLKRTETVTGEDGKTITRTTYITVNGSKVTTTTTTLLTVTREKEKHTGGGTKDVSEDFKLPDISLSGSADSGVFVIPSAKLKELMDNAAVTPDGNKTIYKVKDGNFEYTITENEEDADGLSNDEIVAKLGSDYKVEKGKIYYVGNGQHAELSVDQTNVIRKMLSYTIDATETTKGETTVTGKDEAEASAKEDAVRGALNAAVDKMLADKTITEKEVKELKSKITSATLNADKSGTFEATVNGKKFVLDYTGGTITDTAETDRTDKNDDKTTDNKDHVVKGESYVTSGRIDWTASGEDKGTYSESFGDQWKTPAGAVQDGDPVTEDNKTKTTYTVKNGDTTLTYEVIEETINADELSEDEKANLAWKQLAKTLGREGATAEELKKEGYSISNIQFNGSVKKVSWTVKETKTTTEEKTDEDSRREISLNDTVTKTDDGKYTIKVNGTKQAGFESTDGKTFTKKDGNKTITVTVTDGDALIEKEIQDIITKKYDLDSSVTLTVDTASNTAFYTDATGKKHTFYYSDAVSQTVNVEEETHSSINKTTEADLIAAVKEKLDELNPGEQLQMSGKETYTITKKADGSYSVSGGKLKDEILSAAEITTTVTEIVKKIASNYINYGELSKKDIWELLDLQQVYADGANNEYIPHEDGKQSTDSYWPEDGFQNIHHKDESGASRGEIPSQDATKFGHLSLDAEVSIKDDVTGETYDGVLLSDGLAFKYGHKEEIAGYVDKSKYPDKNYWGTTTYDKDKLHTTTTVKTASLEKDITATKGNVWNGTRYEKVNDKLTYSYTADNSNGFEGKRFYNISGEVAYDKRNTDGFLSEGDAAKLLKKLQDEGLDEASMVAVTVNGKTVYNVYAHKTNLNAIGYMTASANTSANQQYEGRYWNGHDYVNGTWNPGCGQAYYGKVNAGDYDLRIQGLKLVNGKVQGNYGVNYNLGLTTIRNTTGSDNALTVKKTTTTTTSTSTTARNDLNGAGGTKSGKFSCDYSHPEKKEFRWTENDTKGTGEGTYRSFVNWVKNLFSGESKELTKTDGSFDYKYSYTTVSDLEAASKTQTVEKHAEADYTYKTIEVKDVDIVDTEVIVITPDDDPIPPTRPELPPVQDETPVTPEAPVLPPVQDATPDAPVLPTNVILPAVQDAHALPKTGVNWLAAIGLALSGFCLMAGGAWASLTSKNAKH